MRMHRDLLAVHVRGLDDRTRLVLEHLRTKPGRDATVDATGHRELDHVHATPDLRAHRLAAGVGAVAQVLRLEMIGERLAQAKPSVGMP